MEHASRDFAIEFRLLGTENGMEHVLLRHPRRDIELFIPSEVWAEISRSGPDPWSIADRIFSGDYGQSILVKADPIPYPTGDWLKTLGWFVPRSIREPWFGDLCEDRKRMQAEGRNCLFITAATAFQILALLMSWLKGRLFALLDSIMPRI